MLVMGVEDTRLSRCAFGAVSEPAKEAAGRAALKQAYLAARANAGTLAAEISRDMGSLSVHDDTHLDALWELASEISGEHVELNPLEGFVFGGAVLLHDLGLGLAAYPGGRRELEATTDWQDALALALRNRLGRFPALTEIANADDDAKNEALELVLRRRHATQAEALGLAMWASEGEEMHLIPTMDLRRAYGALIGQIAGSHWWELEDLSSRLDRTVNPLPGYPSRWTIDVLKIACLLRVADAAHLDARRAPTFLRAVRRPHGVSALHWTFQNRLLRPVVVRDRVRFNSGMDFSRDDSPAWWVGFDLIRLADSELRAVDDLLADLGRPRFQARGVLGADDAGRLARFVRTAGWTPVNASLMISDVPGVIERLGGAQLYGADPLVPLRELIQNGSDAVRARRVLERRAADWGEIRVRIAATTDGETAIEVADTGVGMSVRTMTTTLIDFGESLWRSPELIDIHPGLAAAGYEPSGRFGIGFFSVLMWGTHVLVISRRMQDGSSATRALELIDGITSRPLIRSITRDERLLDGGTAVKVWIDRETGHLHEKDDEWSALTDGESLDAAALVVRRLAPTLSVRVVVEIGDESTIAVEAADWSVIPGSQLVDRCSRLVTDRVAMLGRQSGPGAVADRLMIIRAQDGTPVGRICVDPGGSAVVTVGGFRASTVPGMSGVLLGHAPNLARDQATPTIDLEPFRDWLRAQADLIGSRWPEPWHVQMTATLLAYGCPIGDLPVCLHAEGQPVTRTELAEYAAANVEVVLADSMYLDGWLDMNGFAVHRVDEIDLDGDWFDVEVPRFTFESYGLPAPATEATVTLEDVIRDIVANEWGSPELEFQEVQLVVGTFEGLEIELPGKSLQRS